MTKPSRRAVLRDCLLPAALGSAALAAGIRPGRALAPETSARPFVSLTDFGITGREATDVSVAFQAAIDTVGRDGGGKVLCPPGLIWAKGLVVPNNVTIEGAGVGATTIKLPDGANTDLIRQSSYAEDTDAPNSFLTIRDLTLNGNKDKNTEGNLVVLRGYRGLLERVRIQRAPRHGILFTERSRSGKSANNSLAGNELRGCFIFQCNGAGLYASNGSQNRIADMRIFDCAIHGNGSLGFYQIDLERSSGFHIKDNQIFSSHLGEIRARLAGSMMLQSNHIEGTGNKPIDGVIAQVQIDAGPWANISIVGNVFHSHTPVNESVTRWIQLDIINNSKGGAIVVSENSFFSEFENGAQAISMRGAGRNNIILNSNGYGGKTIPPEP